MSKSVKAGPQVVVDAPLFRSTHLAALRENRSRRFESNLKPALVAGGVDPSLFQSRFFQDMALLQNRTRGPLFELAGELLLIRHLARLGYAGTELRKQVRLPADDELRIADFYAPAIKTLFEVKSGYICWSKAIRHQVGKDAWLLRNSPEVAEVIWLLFRGASAKALSHLAAMGIVCVDLGFGDGQVSDGPKTVIRV